MLRIRRSFAALATSAVAVSGLAALAPAAHAASGVTVACSIPLFDINWDSQVSADVDFPAKVQVGKSATYTFAGKIVIPDNIRDTAAGFLGGKTMSGTGTVSGSFGGVKSGVDITIPSTPLSTTPGELTLDVKGTGEVTPAKVGAAALVADGLKATLAVGKADGTTVSLAVVCAPAAAFEIATVDVVAAPKAPVKAPVKAASKTTIKIAKKGKKATATVTVKVGKKAAAGKVSVSLKQGKKTKKVSIKLNAKGVGKASFAKLSKGKFTVKATYAGNTTTKGSTKTVNGKI